MESYQTRYNKLKKIVYNIISPHILKFINEYENDKFIISPINSKAFELIIDNNTFINDYDNMPFNKLELGLYYYNNSLFSIDDIQDIINSITIDGSYLIPLFFNINMYEPKLYTIDMLLEDVTYYSNNIFNLSDITIMKQSDKYYKIILIRENINIVLFKISKKINTYDSIKFIELIDDLKCINYLELIQQLQNNFNKNKKLIDILLDTEKSNSSASNKSSRRSSVVSRGMSRNSSKNSLVQCNLLTMSEGIFIRIPDSPLLVSTISIENSMDNSLEYLFDNTTFNTSLLITNCEVDINFEDTLENVQDSSYQYSKPTIESTTLELNDINKTVYNYDTIRLNLTESCMYLLDNTVLRDLLYYYSDEGYKDINSYLLGKLPLVSDLIPKIIDCMIDHIQSREINALDSPFIVWKYMYPSLYGQLILDEYNNYDLIQFSSFVSTTYQPPDDYLINTFSSYFTPMVIFKIIVSPTISNYKKFIFMESVSMYPYEKEVLFIPDTIFRVVNKKFFTFHIRNNKYVQKIVYTLEIVNDNSSSSFSLKQRNVNVINVPDIRGIKLFYF